MTLSSQDVETHPVATLASLPNRNDNAQAFTLDLPTTDLELQRNGICQSPPITTEIRARLVAAFTTLKGKRGAPFSFVTSGDAPSFSTNGQLVNIVPESAQRQPQQNPPSLKLSWLLCPLRPGSRTDATDADLESTLPVKMPSYLVSMTIGQTITDPLNGGILTRPASIALFEHFMRELNAKWEYVLEPYLDTHDSVRQRSRFLFATILFCSAKFAVYDNGNTVLRTDVFLQSRLCSVARNLAIRAFAEGDRSVETMQAFYLLAAWKEPDDDTSYLHSGYAFRILQDLDLEQNDVDKQQVAHRRRTWLALFRQDKQQGLFFLRTPSLNADDEGLALARDSNFWLDLPTATTLDFIACCGAELRRLQSRMRLLVQKASPAMLPCLLEQMNLELSRWKSAWHNHFEKQISAQAGIDVSIDHRLLFPGRSHLNALIGLWEQSVRLNVASAIFRQTLVASMGTSPQYSTQARGSSVSFDMNAVMDILCADGSGLTSSIEGAFETLRQLISIPGEDLRRSPDCVLLLGPSASLYLCLLLCLPCRGVVGSTFQTTAISLIREMTQHVRGAVQSTQDTIAMHATYLESLTDLFTPTFLVPPLVDVTSQLQVNCQSRSQMDGDLTNFDMPMLGASNVSVDKTNEFSGIAHDDDNFFNLPEDIEQNLHMQSLANLLDPDVFWSTSLRTPNADRDL